jgi:mRNA interferase RelE/StbE
MYSARLSDEAKDRFSRLEKKEQARIISVLERCRIRPEHFLNRIVGNPHYSLRAGNQRMIIDVRHEDELLFVVTIEHRKKVYKILPR